MLKIYHLEICKRALTDQISTRALDVISKANIEQDNIRYQFRHPHFHFDSNAFEASYNYIEDQRNIVREIKDSDEKLQSAWKAFGRLTHVVQDFYAHSNYIQLWLNSLINQEKPSPHLVDPMDAIIMQDPDLRSGNVYLLDWIAFIPGLYRFSRFLTPTDSHTHMNLDHPNRGLLFPYAFEAAVKRTVYEYRHIATLLSPSELALFKDK